MASSRGEGAWDDPEMRTDGLALGMSAGRPGVAMLVVMSGPRAGSGFELVNSKTTVGRDPANDVMLDGVSVSRRHLEIKRIGAAYMVADCGSFSGTYLNGEPVEEATLEDRDELQIGPFTVRFFTPR